MAIHLSPSLRRFVDRQIKSGHFKTTEDVINAALRQMAVTSGQADLADLSGISCSADVGAMMIIVLMEATQSAEADLKEIMAEVKAMTNAKAKLRDVINKVNHDVAANAGCDDAVHQKLDFTQGLGSEPAYHRAPVPVLDPEAQGGARLKPCNLHRGKIDGYDQLVAIRDGLKDELDSLSEMSDSTSIVSPSIGLVCDTCCCGQKRCGPWPPDWIKPESVIELQWGFSGEWHLDLVPIGIRMDSLCQSRWP